MATVLIVECRYSTCSGLAQSWCYADSATHGILSFARWHHCTGTKHYQASLLGLARIVSGNKKISYRRYSARRRSLRHSRSFKLIDVGTNRKLSSYATSYQWIIPTNRLADISQRKLESVQLRRHCNSKATPTSRQSIWHIISILWVFCWKILRFGKFRLATTNADHVASRPLSTLNKQQIRGDFAVNLPRLLHTLWPWPLTLWPWTTY